MNRLTRMGTKGLPGIAAAMVLLVTGCSAPAAPDVDATVEAAVRSTQTAQPTEAPSPTLTLSPSPTPRRTNTPTPTATPTASPTATPTRTPRPTNTRGPTNTPAPTNTPKPTLDPAEEKYKELCGLYIELYPLTVDLITENAGDAVRDPLLWFSADWQQGMLIAADTLRMQGQDVRELNPPASLTGIHSEMLGAVDQYDLAADLVTQAIEEYDSDILTWALQAMQIGRSILAGVQRRLDAL